MSDKPYTVGVSEIPRPKFDLLKNGIDFITSVRWPSSSIATTGWCTRLPGKLFRIKAKPRT
jgi:hypothetical protein